MSNDFQKNDKGIIRSWAFFDWANSVYPLVISTAIFPVYYTASTPDFIKIFGTDISNSSVYSYSVSFAYIILAIISPFLCGMADYSGKRLSFMKIFTFFGSIACACLFFFKGESSMWIGTLFFVLATIGFSASTVFYDSFLPIIATEDQYDSVSAKGYAYGYVGSVIVLMLILFMIQKPEMFGITDKSLGPRIGFIMVGVWWLSFAQIPFYKLPKDSPTPLDFSIIGNGYREIKRVLFLALKLKNIKAFLLSFFFYSAGVQTVIYVASIFASKELGMETSELILVILIIQIVGIVGALLFARISTLIGNRASLLIQLTIWALICIAAYFCSTKLMFYSIAFSVGMVMGGIQALSRASYSKLIPEESADDVTSFFGLYDVIYKLAIVMGTLLFGLVNQIVGSMRESVLVLAFLFILGFIAMLRVNFHHQTKVN
jgi:UMF1 family MFS transporter